MNDVDDFGTSFEILDELLTIRNKINKFDTYLTLVDGWLSNYSQELQNEAHRRFTELTLEHPDEKIQWEPIQQDRDESFYSISLNIHSGYIATWYTFFEDRLFEICDILKLGKDVSLRDILRHKRKNKIRYLFELLEKSKNYQIEVNRP